MGEHAGLGWIAGRVRRLDARAIRPQGAAHGLERRRRPRAPHPLIEPGEAYFLHSFAFEGDDVIATTDHGGPVTAAIGRDNHARRAVPPRKEPALRPRPARTVPGVAAMSADRLPRDRPEGRPGRAPGRGRYGPRHRLWRRSRRAGAGCSPTPGASISMSSISTARSRARRSTATRCARSSSVSRAMSSSAAASATARAIERWFDLGVARVVIGTAALEDPDLVRDAARDFPGGIVVAVDARDGMVATKGWADVSDVTVDRSGPPVRGCGRRGAAVHRCRPRRACSRAATSRRRSIWPAPCRHPGDRQRRRQRASPISTCWRSTRATAIEGVITGRALYDGRLDLATAIAVAARR